MSNWLALDVGPVRARPAGVGIYVRCLAAELARQLGPDELTYIGTRADATGLPTSVPNRGRDGRIPYSAWALLRAGATHPGQTLHMTDGLVPFWRPSRKTVVTVLDMTLAERPGDHRMTRYPRIPFILAAPRLADAVIVPSEATAEAVCRLTQTPARKIHVIPLAAREAFRPTGLEMPSDLVAARSLRDHGYILVPGTIEPRKNQLGVLRAFERLVRQKRVDADTQLVIVGQAGWKARRFREALAMSPVRERVVQLGYVSDADLAILMTRAGVVAYLSFAEGFGLPVLEAMACGAPVVTSNLSSLPEVAGDAGQLVDPFDIPQTADALALAIGLDASSRSIVAARAIARASSFSWERVGASSIAVCRP